jgi:rSAM/selenodomain-associated transferase 1
VNAIVLFVKAPVPGRVKTRLCPPLSHEQAATLYRAFARDAVAAARGCGVAALSVAYAPHPSMPDLSWLDDAPAWFKQARGALGKRLSAAFDRAFRAGASKVVIIGSDCPELEPRLLREAFARLGDSQAVLGPARDGGYYLIGLTSPEPSLFVGIEWSGPDVLAGTVGRLRARGMRFKLLAPRADIDTPADLERLRSRLTRNGSTAEHTRRAVREAVKPRGRRGRRAGGR